MNTVRGYGQYGYGQQNDMKFLCPPNVGVDEAGYGQQSNRNMQFCKVGKKKPRVNGRMMKLKLQWRGKNLCGKMCQEQGRRFVKKDEEI